MQNRRPAIPKCKYILLSALCAVTVVISAAALSQTASGTEDIETAQSVFHVQAITDNVVDISDAISETETETTSQSDEQTAEAESSSETDESNIAEEATTENEDGLIIREELPIVQPTLTPEEAEDVSITVDKSEHTLTLYSGDTVIAQYSVGLGSASAEGTKEQEGDNRTPEGEYYICMLNSESKFHLSLGLSYPNIQDADRGLASGLITQEEHDDIVSAIEAGEQPNWYTNLGGQIMIHGQKDDLGGQADWTAGCVAVDDEVMDILWEYCEIGTKVTIVA